MIPVRNHDLHVPFLLLIHPLFVFVWYVAVVHCRFMSTDVGMADPGHMRIKSGGYSCKRGLVVMNRYSDVFSKLASSKVRGTWILTGWVLIPLCMGLGWYTMLNSVNQTWFPNATSIAGYTLVTVSLLFTTLIVSGITFWFSLLYLIQQIWKIDTGPGTKNEAGYSSDRLWSALSHCNITGRMMLVGWSMLPLVLGATWFLTFVAGTVAIIPLVNLIALALLMITQMLLLLTTGFVVWFTGRLLCRD